MRPSAAAKPNRMLEELDPSHSKLFKEVAGGPPQIWGRQRLRR